MTRHWALVAIGLVVLLGGAGSAHAYTPPLFMKKWGLGGSSDPGLFAYPWGVACDAGGNVYVADQDNHRIQVFDHNGNYLRQWGTFGSGDGEFNDPICVAIDATGHVFVTDLNNHRVQKFATDGTYLGQWGSHGQGNGEFVNPFGIATDGAGNVYVNDYSNKRIQKFAGDGTYLAQWSIDTRVRARQLAVGPSGDVYVTVIPENPKLYTPIAEVERFTNFGTLVGHFGRRGVNDSDFTAPDGIAFDAVGRVYVLDYGHQAKVFASDGVYLGKFGTAGTAAGQFDYAAALTANAVGELFFVDFKLNRVSKFGGSSNWFSPTLVAVDRGPVGDHMHFHLGFDNPNSQGPSLPLNGTLFPQPLGASMPSFPIPIAEFSVPLLPPNSHFDIFADVPFDALPPSAPTFLPGGGPGPGGPCLPVSWAGGVDVGWSEQGAPVHSESQGGEVLVAPGAGNSFIQVVTGGTPPQASEWSLAALCPGFTATLVEQNRITPAPAVLPPGWAGFVAVTADPDIVPGTVCRFDFALTCGKSPTLIELNARTCAWATADVADEGTREFGLAGITPNPVRASASIQFTLPHSGRAALEVFDIAGHRVRTLLDDILAPGAHIARWDGTGARGERLRAGMYFVRLREFDRVARRTIVLVN